MQLGISLTGQGALPPEQLTEVVQLAERCGYHSFWVPEIWGCDAVSQLAYVAARTERILLGSAIVPVYTRSAALLAMSAVSLDGLSNGRFILGLGSSGRVVVENLHGVEFGKPLAATREVIEIVRRFVDGDRVQHSGRRFRLNGFKLSEQPRQARLPIYLAAQGMNNIALAGEIADGWLGYLQPCSTIAESVGRFRSAAQAAGRNAQTLVTAMSVLSCVGQDAAASHDLARGHLSYYIGGMGEYHYRSVQARAYQAECEVIRKAWENKDRAAAAAAVSDAMLDDLSLNGAPAQARQTLQRYADAGIDLPIIYFSHGASFETMCAGIEALAPQGAA